MSGVGLCAVIGAVNRACGNQNHVARNHVIGSVVYKVVALPFLHIVQLKSGVIMLGRHTALDVFAFVEIIITGIADQQRFQMYLPQPDCELSYRGFLHDYSTKYQKNQ